MNAKHTSGPWKVRPVYSKGEPMPATIYAGRESIADMTGTSPHDDANARLIAAAPDLLEMAKRANHYAQLLANHDPSNSVYWHNQAINIREAIAKAEGRE